MASNTKEQFSVERVLFTHKVGSQNLTISARLSLDECRAIIQETGRIFYLQGIEYNRETKEATIRLIPGRGTATILESGQ